MSQLSLLEPDFEQLQSVAKFLRRREQTRQILRCGPMTAVEQNHRVVVRRGIQRFVLLFDVAEPVPAEVARRWLQSLLVEIVLLRRREYANRERRRF